MWMSVNIIILTLSALMICIESARILGVIPTPSLSHHVVFRPLFEELARRGHEVTVITTDPAFPKGGTPENLTEINVHDISYNIFSTHTNTVTGNQDDLLIQQILLWELFNEIVEAQIKDNEVQKLLKYDSKYFDLLIIEGMVRPALVFSHVFKAPVIQISSFGAYFGVYEAIGAPTHPFLYPSPARQNLYNLTLWDKVTELHTYYKILYNYNRHEEEEDAMLRRLFGKDVPTLNELKNNIDMSFLNIHPIFEGNYPVPPNVVHIWGIYSKPETELPTELKTYLDSSKHGVIYMSFGTNTDPTKLNPEKIQMFIKVFSQLPYDILWKWNYDTMPGKSKNIRIGKWFPQSDLLRHPNVKLFITQGGLQSTDEAINAAVPLIGFPMLFDQWYNVNKYEHFKIGLRLDFEHADEEQFRKAINTVINDNSYRRNIMKLREMVHDQPMPPLERATWWVEYTLRHGGARYLRSPAANISWADYFELELVSYLLLSVIVVLSIVSFILLKIVRLSIGYFRVSKKIKAH